MKVLYVVDPINNGQEFFDICLRLSKTYQLPLFDFSSIISYLKYFTILETYNIEYQFLSSCVLFNDLELLGITGYPKDFKAIRVITLLNNDSGHDFVSKNPLDFYFIYNKECQLIKIETSIPFWIRIKHFNRVTLWDRQKGDIFLQHEKDLRTLLETKIKEEKERKRQQHIRELRYMIDKVFLSEQLEDLFKCKFLISPLGKNTLVCQNDTYKISIKYKETSNDTRWLSAIISKNKQKKFLVMNSSDDKELFLNELYEIVI